MAQLARKLRIIVPSITRQLVRRLLAKTPARWQRRRAMSEKLYIFDHIAKTGGTTFHSSHLPAIFREEERFVLRGFAAANAEDRERLATLPPTKKARLRIIAGHNAGQLRSGFPDARFITLIRDPLSRVISMYQHAKLHPDAQAVIGRHIAENNVGLEEFVKADLFAKMDADSASVQGWQAKVLLGSDLSKVDLSRPDQVKEAIARRFYLVGHTERLEDFLFLLHVRDGFPLALFNNRLVRGNRELAPSEVETIEKFNRADLIIYELVRRDFERRWSEIWTRSNAKMYAQYMETLSQFRSSTSGDENQLARYH